jgi:hypothetical protein
MNLPISQPRRKLLLWAISLIAAIPFLRLAIPGDKKKTIRLLTQEGKLVEVEVGNLPSKRKKINNDELRNWVKNKPRS